MHPIIEDTLKNFFNEKDFKDFAVNYFNFSFNKNELKSSEISEKLKDQIDYEITDGSVIRTQIDLLITYAEKKLSPEKLIELIIFLGQFAITSGENQAGIDIHEKLVNIAENTPEMTHIKANAYLAIGEIYSRQAQWEHSLNYLAKADEIFKKHDDLKGNIHCENLLGTIQGDKGSLDKAKEHFENALNSVQNLDDKNLTGKIEINLGIICTMQADYDEALSYLKRALLNFEKIRDLKRISEIRQNLGMVYTKKKNYSSAVSEFDLCLDAAMRANYLQSIGIAYLSKAYIYTQQNDYPLADAFADKAMEVSYKINDKLTIAEVYKIKGILKRNTNEYNTAENYLLTSFRLNKDLGNKLNLAETSVELGRLYTQTNDTERSKQYFSEALNYFKKINAKEDIAVIELLIKE